MFKKETNNNILTDGHIEKIMQVFASKADTDHLAKFTLLETVAANDYNLSVSSYVEAMDTREIVDITELNAEPENHRQQNRPVTQRYRCDCGRN